MITTKLLAGTLLAATSIAVATTTGPAQAAPSDNPYTMPGLCGSQFKELTRRTLSFEGRAMGDIVVGRRADQTYCAVLLKYARVGEPTMTRVELQTGMAPATVAADGGQYTHYAGPVKGAQNGRCVSGFGYMKLPNDNAVYGSTGWLNC